MKRFSDALLVIVYAFVILSSLWLLIVHYDITGVVRDTVQS